MIRRGFWLTVGALTGIYGYRRVSAAGRRLRAVGLAREAMRFTRDVREGMDLYRLTHSLPAGSTLMTDHDHDAQPEDGR